MPTISAMMRQNNMLTGMMRNVPWSSRAASSSALFGVGSTSYDNSLLRTGAQKASTNYMGALFGNQSGINSILGGQGSDSGTFRAELKDKIGSLGKAASAAKNLNGGSAGSTAAKSSRSVADATNSLGSFMDKKTNMSYLTQKNLKDNLRSINQAHNNSSLLGTTGKKMAAHALESVRGIVEKETGLTEKTAAAAKEAADKVKTAINDFRDSRERTLANTATAVSDLQRSIDEFNETGTLPSAKSFQDSISMVRGMAADVADFYKSVDALSGFGSNSRMDAGTEAEWDAAMSEIAPLRQGVSDETLAGVGSAADTLTRFAKGDEVDSEDVTKAMSAISNFLTEYNNAAVPDAEALTALSGAADKVSGIVSEAASPFADLRDLQNAVSPDSGRTMTAESVKDSVASVKDMVSEFNNTVSYLNDNRDVSRRFATLAASFSDNSSFARSLEGVGISVSKSGELSVDESKLASALTNNPQGVEAALGQDGLAGRIERKVNMASQQLDRMFPSLDNFLSSGSRSGVYSTKMIASIGSYMNIGNMLNMVS